MGIYLDNAATTKLSKEVFNEMEPYLLNHYGNASSVHEPGRIARSAVEDSRRAIADQLGTGPANIIFTASGTEADNTAILSAIYSGGIRNVFTSKLEHHAVLNTLKAAERRGEIQLSYLESDTSGNVSLPALDRLLESSGPSLISLMHGNNELGNLNPIYEISDLADHHGAIFHSDSVQTMGHIRYNLKQLSPDFLVGSAHKFHGPKGVGFLYARDPERVLPLINGGSQEKAKRAGTENVAGIVGLASALTQAYEALEEHESYLCNLKQKLIDQLAEIPGIIFNGNYSDSNKSLSSILSLSIPENDINLLSHLNHAGIYVSGGSACTSGTSSHVMQAIGSKDGFNVIRFSFSRYNTPEEIDFVSGRIRTLLNLPEFYEAHSSRLQSSSLPTLI